MDNTTTLIDWFGDTMRLMGGAPRVALRLIHTGEMFTAKLGRFTATGGTIGVALTELQRQVKESCS